MAIWKLDGLITLHPYYVVQEELKGFNSVDQFGNLSRSTDVLVTKKPDNFVTILKNGTIMSISFRLAKMLAGRP